ncbi:MAG TPA: copper transporter [Mycobacteriales bacterium]|nr:copper transporter [Mycobacteriales bacterium]
MIDFRYHVVSIIAVFLALGTGIVLGSTALDRPIIDDLKRRTSGLAEDKARLQERIEGLEETVDDDDAFATAVGTVVLPGRLTGQRVTVVSLPGADGKVRDSVVDAVRGAGGRISGQLRLLPRFVEPDAAAEIDDLVTTLATGISPPVGTVPRAAAELAAALDSDGKPDGEVVPPRTTRLVSGFREAGLIAVDGNAAVRPGDLVVFVLGPSAGEAGEAEKAAADRTLRSLVDVITAFAGQGAVVLAAPPTAAADGSLLKTVRDDAGLAAKLSSVDIAGTPNGTIATVLTLADAVRREFGHYGSGPGAEAPLPAMEPTPA